MANTLYPAFKERALRGETDLLTTPVRLALVDTALYTFDLTHADLTALGSAVVSAPQLLVNKSVANGVFDADDVVFPAVLPVGTTVEALVLYLDTGVAATSTLIAYLDTLTGLPFLANGGAAEVRFDNGSNKIFRL